MSYYRTCPRCGANLDPGETCDCLKVEARALIAHVGMGAKSQSIGILDKKTPAGAANTDEGKQTPHNP